MTRLSGDTWEPSQSQSILEEFCENEAEVMEETDKVSQAGLIPDEADQRQPPANSANELEKYAFDLEYEPVSDSETEADPVADLGENQETDEKLVRKKRKVKQGVAVANERRGRGGSNKRRAYTNQEYQMIINAPDAHHRRIIANALDMPWRTAVNIIQRYQKTGKTHDARKDAIRKKEYSAYDSEHRGKWGKLSPKYEQFMEHLIHFNCVHTQLELMELVNKEITRDFLLDCEKLPSSATEAFETSAIGDDGLENGVVLGIRALAPEEREVGGPLDTTAFESNSEFREFCNKYLIKAPSTIGKHLKAKLYTRKAVVIEKATANTPAAMKRRWEFAKALQDLVDGTLGKAFLLFQDEMPVYLHQSRKRGLAKKGQRAVIKSVPTSNMSFRTQVAMAVHPTLGLFCKKQYNPKKTDKTKDGRDKKPSWQTCYGKPQFEEFIHMIMSKILVELSNPSVDGSTGDLIRGAKIYLFVDGAPEHGKQAMGKILSKFPTKEKFDQVLQSAGCSFKILKLPPNSPHLNLCEYYNRMLRAHINHERAKPEVNRVMQRVAGDDEAQIGTIIQTRVELIHNCIDNAFKVLEEQSKALHNYNNFVSWIHKIVEARGKLNYYEPM